MKSVINTVTKEVATVLSNVKEEEATALSGLLKNSKRIFVSGEGRSGLMGKAFAMRLMHGGYEVYVLGETITPSIGADDLLVVISGSGSTSSIFQIAAKAKDVGAKVFLVTTNREAKIGTISDGILVVPAATKHRRAEEPETIQPLGNQFDQSVHLLLDAVIISTLQNKDYQAANNAMNQRHSNLE